MKTSKRIIKVLTIGIFLTFIFFISHGIPGVYVAVGTFRNLVESSNGVNLYSVGAAASPSVYDLQNTPIHAYSGWGSASVTARGEPFSDSGSMWAKVYAHRNADGTVVRKFSPGSDRSASAFIEQGESYSASASGSF